MDTNKQRLCFPVLVEGLTCLGARWNVLARKATVLPVYHPVTQANTLGAGTHNVSRKRETCAADRGSAGLAK